MYSLWRQASESVSAVTARILVQLCELLPLCDFPRSLTLSSLLQFAETACGNVTVLLNGSIVNGFDRNRWNEAVHAALTEQEAVK